MRRLLDEGMDVNVTAWGPKAQGVTPLHLAAQGGHLKVMDELLERGANIDARTKGACGCKFLIFGIVGDDNLTSEDMFLNGLTSFVTSLLSYYPLGVWLI